MTNDTSHPTVDDTRASIAKYLARLDGVTLQEIRSTVGPTGDASNWRKYLGRADGLISAFGLSSPALAQSAEPVAIKPLEWNEYERDGQIEQWDAESGSFYVYYTIELHHDGYRAFWDGGAFGLHDALDDAKAAAQADYEARIRSALVDATAPARALKQEGE